jgi:hypothetical protein
VGNQKAPGNLEKPLAEERNEVVFQNIEHVALTLARKQRKGRPGIAPNRPASRLSICGFVLFLAPRGFEN